jgi:hypothetical protein
MKEVLEQLYDDLVFHQSEGTEKVRATETVQFAVNGQAFEIDLSDDNAAAFEEIIRPFREAARTVEARKSGSKSKKGAASTAVSTTTAGGTATKKTSSGKAVDEENQKIRTWAKEKGGFDISDRGRIPQEVKDAYYADTHHAAPGTVTQDQLTDNGVPDQPQLNFTQDAGADDSGAEAGPAAAEGNQDAESNSVGSDASEPERV